MKKGSNCNPAMGAAWLLRNFLGAFMLLMGLSMLMDYQGTVDFLMGVGGGIDLGAVSPVADLVTQIVAYTWPVVATLIGLSLLFKFKKCLAIMVFAVYLLIFALGHIWTGDITGATYDVLIVLYIAMMKACCGMGMMCEKK